MLAFVFCRPKKFVLFFGLVLGFSSLPHTWLTVLSAKTQKEIVCYSLRNIDEETPTAGQSLVKRDPASQNPFPKIPSDRHHVLCVERYDLQRFPRSVVRFVLIEEGDAALPQKSKVVARRYYHLMVPESENRRTASIAEATVKRNVEEYGVHQALIRFDLKSKVIELLFLNDTLPQKFRYSVVDFKRFYSHLNRYHHSAAERVISSE